MRALREHPQRFFIAPSSRGVYKRNGSFRYGGVAAFPVCQRTPNARMEKNAFFAETPVKPVYNLA